MSFLYPSLLFALSAISIPIIVHLFHLRKAKQVQFSHTALLFKTELHRQKKSKIKHLLILLMRILAIIFLVLAFSQPFIKKTKSQTSLQHTAKLIVLDASYSMQAKLNDVSAFEIAQEYLKTIANQAEENDEFYVITGSEISSIPYSKKSLNELSSTLKWDYHPFHFIEAFRKFRKISPELAFSEIVVLSDFQNTNIDSLRSVFSDSSCHFTVLPLIPTSEIGNIFVDSVWVEEQQNKVDGKFKIAVSIKNSGNLAKTTTLSLTKDKVVLGTTELSLGASSSKQISFDVTSSSELYQSFQFTWEDFPIYADNQFYFTLFNPDHYKVSLVQEEENTFLNKIYETESLFQVHSFTPKNIDYKTLESSDLVVFSNLSMENASIESLFKSVLKKSGSLVFIPTEIDKSVFLNQLGYSIYTDTTKQKIKFPSENDVFFKQVFSKWDTKTSMPSSKKDYNLRGINALLEFQNEDVFVGKKQIENRQVYLFSASYKSITQEFLKHSLSLPLFFKALYLSKSQNNDLFYRMSNRDISLVLQDSLTETPYTLSLLRDSLQVIPQQNNQPQLLTLSASAIQKPGIYKLEKNQVTQAFLSFNTVSEESELRYPDKEKVLALENEFSNLTVANIQDLQDVKSFVSEKENGMPLWKYCIILVLVFLALEMALIKWMK